MQTLQLRGRRNDLVTIEGTSGNWYGMIDDDIVKTCESSPLLVV